MLTSAAALGASQDIGVAEQEQRTADIEAILFGNFDELLEVTIKRYETLVRPVEEEPEQRKD